MSTSVTFHLHDQDDSLMVFRKVVRTLDAWKVGDTFNDPGLPTGKALITEVQCVYDSLRHTAMSITLKRESLRHQKDYDLATERLRRCDWCQDTDPFMMLRTSIGITDSSYKMAVYKKVQLPKLPQPGRMVQHGRLRCKVQQVKTNEIDGEPTTIVYLEPLSMTDKQFSRIWSQLEADGWTAEPQKADQ